MKDIKLSKRFYEKNAVEGSKKILKKMNKKTSKTGIYNISTNGLILPEILAVLLKTGHNLDIYLQDNGECLMDCNVKIYNQKGDNEGEILRLSISGHPGNKKEEVEEYRRQIEEAQNSEICERVLKELII